MILDMAPDSHLPNVLPPKSQDSYLSMMTPNLHFPKTTRAYPLPSFKCPKGAGNFHLPKMAGIKIITIKKYPISIYECLFFFSGFYGTSLV